MFEGTGAQSSNTPCGYALGECLRGRLPAGSRCLPGPVIALCAAVLHSVLRTLCCCAVPADARGCAVALCCCPVLCANWLRFCLVVRCAVSCVLLVVPLTAPGLLLAPCGYMVSSNQPTVHGLWTNLADGLRCALSGEGCNSQCDDIRRITDSGVCDLPVSGQECGLEYAPISVWLYILVCCLFNMLMLWVISNNTAVLYFVALATIIPVVSLISTSSVYSSIGLCTVGFSALQIVGLVTTVCGIVVYRLQSDEVVYEDSTDQEHETECVYSHRSIADTIREMSGVPKEEEDEVARTSGFRSFEPPSSTSWQRVPTNPVPMDHHARDLERGKGRAARRGNQASCS
eukprot:TRINITY_DN4774_c0_g3_i2.p1 TRINITY_DN4774_c0_g3~~TRINITY_DN4774_c0_g3_i2.p1  ORF type:complete len:345 (+),score=70.81 TRINITY_DN4774_c0_g3_i2:782-1816(+)